MLVKIIDSNGNRNIQRGVETENWERATSKNGNQELETIDIQTGSGGVERSPLLLMWLPSLRRTID